MLIANSPQPLLIKKGGKDLVDSDRKSLTCHNNIFSLFIGNSLYNFDNSKVYFCHNKTSGSGNLNSLCD